MVELKLAQNRVGAFCLALFALLFALVPFVYFVLAIVVPTAGQVVGDKYVLGGIELPTDYVVLNVLGSVILIVFPSLPLLYISAVIFSNVRRKYLVTADNDGFAAYAGLLPLGKVSWHDVESVTVLERHTLYLRSVAVVRFKYGHGVRLNKLQKMQSNFWSNDGMDMVLVPFDFCHGKPTDNAQKFAEAFRQSTDREPLPPDEAPTDV